MRLSRGRSTETSFRLCSRAPRTTRRSWVWRGVTSGTSAMLSASADNALPAAPPGGRWRTARVGAPATPGHAPYSRGMALPIEDYAVLGDTGTAALVGRDGSVDWLCLPRFDSPACFAALLGDHRNGRWLLGPEGRSTCTRRYVGNSAALESTYTTDTGTVRVLDVMPIGDGRADIV